MRRLAWIIAALLTVSFYLGSLAGTQMAEAFDGSIDPGTKVLSIIDSIPQPRAGMDKRNRVSDDTSFGVLIESRHGINLTKPGSIRFTIDDGVHYAYRRDLSSDAVRVVEVADEDLQKTLLWVVYERSLETYLPPLYFPDTIVHISVEVTDVDRNRLSPQQFRFKIEPDPGHAADFDRIPEYEFVDKDNFIPLAPHESAVEIFSGELQGARIVYSSTEPLTPGFGAMDEIQALNSEDSQGVGVPLNLTPHTVFHTPVKIFIPFPEGTDIAGMDIFYHNGKRWLPACGSDGNLLSGGTGWMVPGSRVNHAENRPPLVEIQVYHFSATQGGFVVASTGTTRDNDHSNRSGTVVVVKCFIETAIYKAKPAFGLAALLGVLGMVGVMMAAILYQRPKWNGFYSTKVFK
jgi:hypothetical protein